MTITNVATLSLNMTGALRDGETISSLIPTSETILSGYERPTEELLSVALLRTRTGLAIPAPTTHPLPVISSRTKSQKGDTSTGAFLPSTPSIVKIPSSFEGGWQTEENREMRIPVASQSGSFC